MAVDYIPRTRELYSPLPPYRWADNRDVAVPWTPLATPLAELRVMLIASGGVHLASQPPFHFKDDASIRIVPTDTPTRDLRISHFGYPTADAETDPNCVFPIEALREMGTDGTIEALAPEAVTFMGGIYSHRRVAEELIPPIVDKVKQQNVDLCYIVPA
jgi:D-proline reductase (dithiol) PrdB